MIQLALFTVPESRRLPVPGTPEDRYPNDIQLSFVSDGPPFRPGQFIRGVKNTVGAEELRRLFGDNYALLARECEWRDGGWTLFGRPAGEFKILNNEACVTLRVKLRLMRIACKMTRKESISAQDTYYYWRCTRFW